MSVARLAAACVHRPGRLVAVSVVARVAALTVVLTGLLFALPLAGAENNADWPVYRHDVRLTGMTPAKGRISRPKVLAQYYLGTEPTEIVATPVAGPANQADFDGDGQPEQFALDGDTIRVTSLAGEELWNHTLETSLAGAIVRVCQLFPGRADRQLVVFSKRMDTGEGQGYCFRFEDGVRHGKLAWTTGPLTGYHAPTLIVDDVDGDGLPEIVVAPHYRAQIFSGQTGKLEAEVPWDVGRNYGLLVARERPGRKHKDIYIVCDFVLHVDCIRFADGAWTHAWGHKYVDPSAPAPRGRQKYMRVGPSAVVDLDRDGRDEVVYMLVDSSTDDQWHLRIHDGESGEVRTDVAGIWIWSMADLDGDDRPEIVYTPTTAKRPRTFCDLHVAHYADQSLVDIAVIADVAPAITNVGLSLSADTIADQGQQDLVMVDTDGNGVDEVVVSRRGDASMERDTIESIEPTANGGPQTRWSHSVAGHRLDLVEVRQAADGGPRFGVRDLTAGIVLELDAGQTVLSQTDLGAPGGFATTPIAVDLDGDGTNEIVVQTAMGQIVALGVNLQSDEPLVPQWSRRGASMNHQPGYAKNGALCPQANDLDGDGKPEVLFAVEDEHGNAALRAVDGRGKPRWTRAFDGCAWGGQQAGVNLWTFGRFSGVAMGSDVYVDVHRRSKGSGEGWVLDGRTGEPIWHRLGLVAESAAMPFGGGMPAVADINGDGTDDLVQAFYTIYGAISGADGQPLFPPAFLTSEDYFGRWIAYSSPTIADLNGDGAPDVYLNSASYARGGYAAVEANGKPLWVEFHDNTEGSNGFGPVGDFDGDGALEIGVGVLDGTLVCLNAADGTRKWTARHKVAGDIVAADIDNDAVAELVFWNGGGQICAVSGADGQLEWTVDAMGRPIVADVTGDGWAEVIAAGGDGQLRVIGSAP